MTSFSYPSPTYNAGSLTDLEFERLTAPQAADGLMGHPSDTPMVYADGTGVRVVKVRANRRALVRGFEYDSGPNELPLTLAANSSGATRIDVIVLRLDRATWRVTEGIVQGTPGAGVPQVTQNVGSIGVWELPLAEVTVVNGASAISGGAIIPRAWYLSDDGQILCTPTTRPPAAPGRQIHETDTNVTWEATGVGEPWRALGGLVAVNSMTARNNLPNKHDGLAFWRTDLKRVDVWTGSGWRIFSRPTQASVVAFQGTGSTLYTDLTTHGPEVTVETGDAAEVTLSAQIIGPGTNFCMMSFQVSGASDILPSDFFALTHNGNFWINAGITFTVTGLTPGINNFKCKYRCQIAPGPANFDHRRISVRPI